MNEDEADVVVALPAAAEEDAVVQRMRVIGSPCRWIVRWRRMVPLSPLLHYLSSLSCPRLLRVGSRERENIFKYFMSSRVVVARMMLRFDTAECGAIKAW